MKLKGYKHSLEDKMLEFDLWVTPTLGEIRDAIQFKADLNTMSSSFDKVASLTNNFSSVGFCSAGVLILTNQYRPLFRIEEPDD